MFWRILQQKVPNLRVHRQVRFEMGDNEGGEKVCVVKRVIGCLVRQGLVCEGLHGVGEEIPKIQAATSAHATPFRAELIQQADDGRRSARSVFFRLLLSILSCTDQTAC